MTDEKAETAEFDAGGFFRALEATVQARGVTWKDVSSESGVGQSTLSRMAQGKGPDSAGLAKLAAWSGLNPADFVPTLRGQQEPLAQVARFLRHDPRLTREAADVLQEMLVTTYKRLASRSSR